MKRRIKNIVMPHKGNDYHPHALRKSGICFVSFIAIAVLLLSLLYTYVIPRSDFLAAVIPEVLIDLTNDNRLANGRTQLTYNPVLAHAAQLKANDMAEKGYFSHNSPGGVTPWHWFIQAGYQFSSAGENLAVHYTDSEEVAEAWMNSAGHRANILNNDFTEIGIATARGRYDGYSTIFVVQFFGRPAPGAVASASTPEPVEVEDPEPTPEPEVIPEPEPVVTVPEPAPEPVVTVPEPEYEVIEETDTFIAIEVIEEELEEADVVGDIIESDVPEEAVGLLEPESNAFERLLVSPYHIVQWVYLILMLGIVSVLILTVVIEFEKQHPRNAMYGLVLLVFVGLLLYITRTYVFTGALIL